MPSLRSILSDLVGSAFVELGLDHAAGAVVPSQRPELGAFQSNGALSSAKQAGRPPREIAQAVADLISTDPRIAHAEVAGPGFLNIDPAAELLIDVLVAMQDSRCGVGPTPRPRRIVVDYGGANVAKELHVGHLRVALIGDALKRVFRFLGHEAIGDVHLGDWGAPMGQLIAEIAERRPDLPYFDESKVSGYPESPPVTLQDLTELYPEAARKAREDREFGERTRLATVELQGGRPGYLALWEGFRAVSVEGLEDVYGSLGIEFELWLGEASVHQRIKPMIDRLTDQGVAIPSDGAVVVPVDDPADTKEIPPLILVTSRGSYTYGTTDLATVEERVEDLDADEIVYVVDLRQALHFEQVFRAARKAGIAPEEVRLDHSGNGTVNGPDGRPFKTRTGGTPLLRDTIAEAIERAHQRLDESELALEYPQEEREEIARRVGLAALKFGDLINHRTSEYAFDLDRFTRLQGKTGPYVQYVAVRAASILSKAAAAGYEAGPPLPPTGQAERRLVLALAELPEVLERTADQRAPNHLAEYAYELAGSFNRFYDACHIMSEPDAARRGSWLTLVGIAGAVLRLCLELLGIETPERM